MQKSLLHRKTSTEICVSYQCFDAFQQPFLNWPTNPDFGHREAHF